MTENLDPPRLFVYGGLMSTEVQLDTFGHALRGEPAVLAGYRAQYSPTRVRATGNPLDKVIGTVVTVTEEELDAADDYEAPLCSRISVILANGRSAWAYLPVES